MYIICMGNYNSSYVHKPCSILGNVVISMSRTIISVSEAESIDICAELTFGLTDGNIQLRFETVDIGEGKRFMRIFIKY